MVDPEFVERVNMELDGVLSRRESARLRERIASDPEAAEYVERLRAVLNAVDQSEEPEPPSHLEERILAAVPWGRYPTHRGVHERSHFWDRWFLGPRLRYAAVFGFGIVFGILVYAAMSYDADRSGRRLDNSDFFGTMIQNEKSDGFKETNAFAVDFAEVSGRVVLRQSDRMLLTEVALDSPKKIEWTVQYDADDLSLVGYQRLDGGTDRVVSAQSEMRVVQSGDARYLIYFTRMDDPLTPIIVRIFSADQLLLEQLLTPAVD
jgi:hypothetical protein